MRVQLENKTESQLLFDLMEGLDQGIGAAQCLMHTHHDPRWMALKDMTEALRKDFSELLEFQAMHKIFKAAS